MKGSEPPRLKVSGPPAGLLVLLIQPLAEMQIALVVMDTFGQVVKNPCSAPLAAAMVCRLSELMKAKNDGVSGVTFRPLKLRTRAMACELYGSVQSGVPSYTTQTSL